MSNEKSKPTPSATPAPPAKTASGKTAGNPPPPPARTGRLFRPNDWWTFAAATILVFIGYYLTLAPDLTLEDCGELAVGSFYAGVPHPPGYPVWTLFTYLFTVLIPFGNIAWRVALASAVSGALACGIVAQLVSRGSSLLLESIPELKNIDRRLENALCLVTGLVSALIFGFNGFMWSQSVIVEVYPFSVLSFMLVLACILHWIYSPEKKRYLYWASFWFGICFTNHQTLIVAAMGIEVAILAAQPKLGRDVFIANSVIYLLGLLGKSTGVVTSFDNNAPLFMIFNVVGIGSIVTALIMISKLGKPMSEWKPILIALALWIAGAAFYFYLPISSMTNPPMNWAYPRTKEGFYHALSRGQYDKITPTTDPFKFFEQVWMYLTGAADEFSLVFLLIALIPFFFYTRMQKRERAWLAGLTGMYLGLAFLLMILLNPNLDRQSFEQTRVFFAASHIIISMFIGYGITILGGLAALHYARFRNWFLYGGAIAGAIELYNVLHVFDTSQFKLLRVAAVIGLGVAVCFTAAILLFRTRAPLGAMIVIFAIIPIRSILANWSDNEQRGHLFGYWFGHDMFTPPFKVYPEMARNAILFGGTDPGRFCPTYMIFDESFIPPRCKPRDPNFDRRDVYIITQNALADHTYLNYIRAHYNRSTEHDPYFFSDLVRSDKAIQEGRTNLLAEMLLPLDKFLTAFGERVEARRRREGVFPPKEIKCPTPDDSQNAFQDYIVDAERRMRLNQLKPGEDVRMVDNRVQVAGQTAVMAINGLLTKVIFEQNPGNEFYVEESFPLDWMYPHLTPFGIIMKINRQQVPEITEDMLKKDHEFWTQYSQRLVGNWITYDTPLKDICAFADRVYLRRDFTGFTGDRKFVRDDVAQKSFSKLRSAIGGLYAWRLSQDCPVELRPKTALEQQRILRETEFALKQSYAFCPYSPEAVYKLMNLLMGSGRLEDAIQITETSLRFDPSNPVFQGLLAQLRSMRPGQASLAPTVASTQANPFAQLEERYRSNPGNVQVAMELAGAYKAAQKTEAANHVLESVVNNPQADVSTLLAVAQSFAEMGNGLKLQGVLQKLKGMSTTLEKQYYANTNNVPLAFQLVSVYLVSQETNQAKQLLEDLVSRPRADPSTLLSAAQAYAQLLDTPKLEATLEKLAAVVPESPEAWYDLATVQAAMGKNPQALNSLRKALVLNQQRLKAQPGAKDLRTNAASETRFAQLKQLPEFQQLIRTN
jgi:tetratricopeptide (TPR) repeat protein